MSSRWMRNSLVYLLIFVAVIAVLFTLFSDSFGGSEEISITQVVNMAARGDIDAIEVKNEELIIETATGETFTSRIEEGASLVKILEQSGIDPSLSDMRINVKGTGGFGSLFGILINFLPLIFFGAILLFMMRQAQGNSSQTFSFGKSKARLFDGNSPSVTFDDVAGADEAKEELKEIVDFLRFPERYTALGAKIPTGILLIGPPGTGKTLISRAVAGEAGVPFFSISGSEFVEMFVGVGASRVRDLFDQAKRNEPAIVFIDEIDAVGRHRGAGLGGGHDEREQTLNQILVQMDGFDTTSSVIVIAATNRPDILDPALLRPGRFDRQVVLDNPDIRGRRQILEVHSKGKPLADDVQLEHVARATPGFSGADLANLVNEAAILAARRGLTVITSAEFAESVDRVIAGPERKSRVISPREKEITAYHEAGHALVGHLLPEADPVAKISIVSRGQMGGYTRFIPEEESSLVTRKQLTAQLAVALGGRTAEEIQFNQITTGASNDLEQATNIARKMVTRFGMSKKLGPRTFGKREELVFLGREISEHKDYSDEVAETIDDEVHTLIEDAHEVARKVLTEARDKLEQVAKYLIEYESVEENALDDLLGSTGSASPDPMPAD